MATWSVASMCRCRWVSMPMGDESSEDAVRRVLPVLPVLHETERAMLNLI